MGLIDVRVVETAAPSYMGKAVFWIQLREKRNTMEQVRNDVLLFPCLLCQSIGISFK